MAKNPPPLSRPLSPTGIIGLDNVLGGGITSNRVYLIEGNPGSGKTTLALQYLLEGLRLGEKVLYITLSETKLELAAVADSHGWTLDGLEIVQLIADEAELLPDNQFTMFQPSEVQMGETTQAILTAVEQIKPQRVVIDSLSELRLLAQSALRYRRQILALKQFFSGRQCTVLMLDDCTSDPNDLQLQSIAHGVITLDHLSPEYGAERRRLRITKLRGQQYRGGYHDFNIEPGGLHVFPRLIAAEHIERRELQRLQGTTSGLDALLGGGIDFGSSVLLVGPAGSGKSSIAIDYAFAAVKSGQRAALFVFDERIEILLRRMEGLGLDLQPYLDSGLLTIQQVDPTELSPGEFACTVQNAAEGKDGHLPARVVVIDSLNGYLHSMPEEEFLTSQLHELLTYLGHKGVVTFLVMAQQGTLGNMLSPVDTTYLADSVVLFRYFETGGEIRQAVSVVKNRSGKHERSIRELKLDGRIIVGEPLAGFHGILTGTPVYKGDSDALMGQKNA